MSKPLARALRRLANRLDPPPPRRLYVTPVSTTSTSSYELTWRCFDN